ncbi:GMC oxidoreductase [Paenibacillus arenilitoris]|uniref:GMC family oxidoreductase n=1 Tax=Paenibacillus arenilitoris TaxID=2772299 RepID=A0A927H6H1_9BACL|nr:GMC family oxidoreductase [Paenibacillus arenilitoris]MBD2869975.1 GMC family oxidoreductase [Paenibacillus arenilitoris]
MRNDSASRTAQWLPLASLEDMADKEYDVLVVGTGAGGGAMLWRLLERLGGSGKKIGVLERGGLLLPTHVWNIATMSDALADSMFLDAASMPPDFLSPQIYAIGGRTLFWGLAAPRMSLSDLAGWPVPLREMNDYYRLAEKIMAVSAEYTRGSSLEDIVLKRLQGSGYPDAIDAPLAINVEPTKFGVVNSNPFFSSIVWLAEALNAPFDLAVHSRVTEAVTEKGRTVGVCVRTPDGRNAFIKAKNVVLAASTFGSPQILLQSGIEGAAIGRYLTNHSRVMGFGIVRREEFPEVFGPLHIIIPPREDRPYQIQIAGPDGYFKVQKRIQPLQPEWGVAFYGSGRVESRRDNRIELDPADIDEDGVPKLKIRFAYSEKDQAVIDLLLQGVRDAAAAAGIALVAETDRPDAYLLDPGLENHEIGTCRMGVDPQTSATNPYGRIHGVEGLFVADNSVIPTSGTANPTLTTVALALRTADHIVRHRLQA